MRTRFGEGCTAKIGPPDRFWRDRAYNCQVRGVSELVQVRNLSLSYTSLRMRTPRHNFTNSAVAVDLEVCINATVCAVAGNIMQL